MHYADRKGFSAHITTSDFGVTKKKIKSLSDDAVLVFGIDGIGEIHDMCRAKSAPYAHLLKVMAYCQDRPKEIITPLWRGSLEQLEEIISMPEKCGAALHVNALIPAGRARNHPEISLTGERNEIVYQFRKERKKKFAHIFAGLILKEMWALVSFSGRYVLVMCLTKIFLLLLRRHKRLGLFARVSWDLKGR